MQNMCTRCHKYMAVVFITKLEDGKTTNEGLCLKCATELGIKPVNDILKRMNISEDDLDAISDDMLDAMTGLSDMFGSDDDEDDENDDGKTATFPFLHKLFSSGDNPVPPTPQQPPSGGHRAASGRNPEDKNRAPKRKFLESYCISLSARAKEGKLDSVIGREDEIERVLQILNRRQKNNPCLIGEPGVGKTAIAEGLAQRITDGNVPPKLKNKEIYLLDLTAVVAGTQFRGQFESRMKGLIEEIKKLGNIVLVIDEVHTLVGAGDAEGSMNAANILKPALSRGEIQVIGATTFNEYRKHIEKDAALERRFQPITVSEPSIEQATEIMFGVAHYYEQFHGVRISPEIIAAAVNMSERYITDRFLPDKAIDLIDEACSGLNLHDANINEAEAIRMELESIRAEYAETLSHAQIPNSAYARMAELKTEESRLENRYAEIQEAGVPPLTIDHLARVIEQWTGIPAASIQEQEYERLAKLEDRLKERLVGQDEAVKSVSAAIRRGRVGISAKKKPVSFIFVGPTGVGKTELVKCLAQDLFSAPEALVRLDMSEFMEKHAVSRIVGAPPGYVGYDEAGQLTEKIRRKPYSVVLFDEIEKAHPDVLNILLQILDDGHITDAQGRKVNFQNTVIIMTSNAGSDRTAGLAGFAQSQTAQSNERSMKALTDIMRPEFLNRVDEIVTFNPLNEENFTDIANIMLGDLKTAMEQNSLTLTYDDSLIGYLVKKSFSVKYGARNLRRLIQKEVEDAIASRLISNYADNITSVHVSVSDDTVVLS
ncbi:MAG: ATP-dependent Clp protease ATP-binding subunit [Oscillospiraceae bacterium]|nr:ATP-dependent Clp protease ATP-binding subunit [Oscillospiraceae bacterium]